MYHNVARTLVIVIVTISLIFFLQIEWKIEDYDYEQVVKFYKA